MFRGIASAFLVLLLCGFALGVALFRPIARSPTSNELTTPDAKGEQAMGENPDLPPADTGSVLDEIEQKRASPEEEQDRLAREWEKLWAEQGHLAQEWEELRAENARLAQEWEGLEAERARLDEQRTRLDETEDRLRAKEVRLAELEQRVEGRLRWSVVASAVGGALALSSILVLAALMRPGHQGAEQGGQQDRTAQAHQTGHVAPCRGLGVGVAAPTYSDNGRDRESTDHRTWERGRSCRSTALNRNCP